MTLSTPRNRRWVPVVVAALAVAAMLPAGKAKASLSAESLKTYVRQVGAKVESSNGNVLVTSMAVGRERLEIRVRNDSTKQVLGFYAFDFGNVADAANPADVYEYLLLANSELGIGSFFVDKDRDIGYKCIVDTRDPLSFETFATIYNAMVNVVKERGPRIRSMMKPGTAAPKQDAEPPAEPPAETMEPPPSTPPATPPATPSTSTRRLTTR